jgi:hypothetical protein
LNYIEKIRSQLCSSASTTTQASDSEIDSQLTFGVEIEFLRPRSVSKSEIANKIKQAGVKCRTESLTHSTRNHWKIVSDQSVQTSLRGYEGYNEIVSPILKGTNGLKQLEKVCKVLNELDCKINTSCGLHVHHGCKESFSNPIKVAKNAAMLYHKFQSKFDRMFPSSRRNNDYASPFSSYDLRIINSQNIRDLNRYHAVNLQAYWRHGTVEFRQHQGSLNYKKISSWIKMTQKIMTRANELTRWQQTVSSVGNQFEQAFNFSTELTNYYQERVHTFRMAA